MAAVYPLTLEDYHHGDVDLDGTVKVLAVTSGYVYDDAHEFLDDVGAGFRLGTAQTLLSKTFTDGLFSAAQVSYTGTSNGDVIAGLVYYIDTGVEATSRLLAFEDRAGGAAMAYTSSGIAIPIRFDNGCFKI